MAINQEKLAKVTEILKSVAHPLRISIIELLAENESLVVTDIYRTLKIEQAEASRQLGILKRSGVLKAERSGKNIRYSLADGKIIEMLNCIEQCKI